MFNVEEREIPARIAKTYECKLCGVKMQFDKNDHLIRNHMKRKEPENVSMPRYVRLLKVEHPWQLEVLQEEFKERFEAGGPGTYVIAYVRSDKGSVEKCIHLDKYKLLCAEIVEKIEEAGQAL